MEMLSTIDTAVLMDASGGDRDMAVELIHLYLDLTAKELVLLEKAVTNLDTTAINAIAHKCAGSSMTCGMTQMAGLLKDLEYESALGLLDDVHERLKLINEGLIAVKTDAELFLSAVNE